MIDSLLNQTERHSHDLRMRKVRGYHSIVAVHPLDAALKLRVLHSDSAARQLHVSDGHQMVLHFLGYVIKLDGGDVAVRIALLRIRVVHGNSAVERHIGMDVAAQIVITLFIRSRFLANDTVLHSDLIRGYDDRMFILIPPYHCLTITCVIHSCV